MSVHRSCGLRLLLPKRQKQSIPWRMHTGRKEANLQFDYVLNGRLLEIIGTDPVQVQRLANGIALV